MTSRRLLNVKQASELLGMSEKWMWAQIHRRALPAVRLGRSVRLLQTDLENLIDASTTPAVSDSPLTRASRPGSALRTRSVGPIPVDRDGTA